MTQKKIHSNTIQAPTRDGKVKGLLEGPILRSLFKLAVPIVIANVLQAGYQLTDAFWVGRLGGAAVASVAISFPIMFLSISLGAGLAIAGSTLIAQYFGAGDKKMVNHVAEQTLLMIVLVSIVLSVIGYFIAPYYFHSLGVAPDVYEGALGFLRVSFIGLVFNFFFFMFQSIMRGIGEATMPVYIVLGTVALNFALDPLFIYGWGAIPGYGVVGASIATVCTQFIAALIGLRILMRGTYGVQIAHAQFKPDWAYAKRAFFLGLPASIEMSGRALGITMMTYIIATFGTVSVAANGVGGTIMQVVIIPAIGLSMAIATLAGQNIGAGNIDRANRIGIIGSWVGFGVLTAVGILVFIFAPSIVSFFVPGDPNVISLGAHFLRIMCLAWGTFGVQFALTGVLRASGNMTTAMILTLVGQWVFQFPLAYILALHTSLGVDGMYWAVPIANVIMTFITIAVYMRGSWKKKRLINPREKLSEKVTEDVMIEEGVRG